MTGASGDEPLCVRQRMAMVSSAARVLCLQQCQEAMGSVFVSIWACFGTVLCFETAQLRCTALWVVRSVLTR